MACASVAVAHTTRWPRPRSAAASGRIGCTWPVPAVDENRTRTNRRYPTSNPPRPGVFAGRPGEIGPEARARRLGLGELPSGGRGPLRGPSEEPGGADEERDEEPVEAHDLGDGA